MAKKKEVIETEEHLAIQLPPTPTPTVSYKGTDREGTAVYKHPVQDRVLEFREKGFDNNRIAALLGIQKHFVDGIE